MFAHPQLKLEIKKTQNAACPDHEQRGIPSVSKSEIEIANSNTVTNAESFSKLLLYMRNDAYATFTFSSKTKNKDHADSSCL